MNDSVVAAELELIQIELKSLIPYVGFQERLKINKIVKEIESIKRKIEYI